MNKIHVIHMIICFIYSKKIESGILVSGMSIVWEETNGCAKQYMCDVTKYHDWFIILIWYYNLS